MPLHKPRSDLRLDPRRLAGRFDRVAWCYRFLERLFLVPRQARTIALEWLDLHPGDSVLSIGCGQGRSLGALAKAVGPDGHVNGIDLSTVMLRDAERRIRKNSARNVRLQRISLFQLRDKEHYDRAFFEFSLSSFGDPQAAIRRAWDLLEPGGRSVVLDGRLPPRLSWLTKPALPAIRWFLDHTVLGDPDMDPSEELRRSGIPHRIRWFLGGTYFVACLEKQR